MRFARSVSIAVVCAIPAAAAAGQSADLRKTLAETERQFLRFAGDALTPEERQQMQRGEIIPIGAVTPSADMKRCQETFVRALRAHPRGRTAEMLGEAARYAMTDVMKALLAAGAAPDAPFHGHAPLWWAIRADSVEAVRLLADAGANAAAADVDGLSGTRVPLIVSAADAPTSWRMAAEVIRVLLAHGAAVDSAVQGGPWNGETALFKAARHGNAPLVALLLEKGADPNRRLTDTGHTPLMSGAGYPEVVRVLLDRGAELHATDNFGRSATIFAALDGCPKAVAFLRERGGRVDVPDHDGKTASMYLAEFGTEAIPSGICNPNPE